MKKKILRDLQCKNAKRGSFGFKEDNRWKFQSMGRNKKCQKW